MERLNILVTGGAGFIGSHLCEELVKSANVICIDNFLTSHVRNIAHLLEYPNFRFINYDINYPFDLEQFSELEDFNIKYKGLHQIYHLACPTSISRFEELMVETALVNSVGTKNVLDVAVKHKTPFLLASSAVVYGPKPKGLDYIPEDYLGTVNFLTPRASYDEGKRFSETIAYSYHLKHDVSVRIARIFRTYGPRMLLKDNQIVTDYIDAALDGKDIVIYGDETFSTTLCYVADIVEGMIKMMNVENKFEVVNLGSETVYPLVDVAEKIIQLAQTESKIVFEDPLMFLSELGVPDLTKAKQEYGWLPVVGLDKGLKATFDFVKADRSVMHMQ